MCFMQGFSFSKGSYQDLSRGKFGVLPAPKILVIDLTGRQKCLLSVGYPDPFIESNRRLQDTFFDSDWTDTSESFFTSFAVIP